MLTSPFVAGERPKSFVVGPDGKPVAVPGKENAEEKPNGKNKKPGDDKAEKEGKDNKEGESPEPKVIRRGEVVDESANPDEFKATVGTDGKVAFQFRNQPWPQLVQWLSDISDQPLDWLELPGDRVNVATPGRYSVAETKDLFNRHLLSRGYTILDAESGMTVVKTETINPAMVPRVNVDQLGIQQPFTYVRTSLDVGWLSAEKLSEELAAMLSSNGRLTAMTTTNRIEAMDAAANLQDIAKVLEQEISAASREQLAPEFQLRYLPAEEAKRMLEAFLGIEKKSSAPMTPQQMQMMQQQMRNQGKVASAPKKPDISVVADVRRNTVIIRAPADRTAIAMEFLKRIDVRSNSVSSLSDIQTRVQVFRLASLDPEKLIEIIGDMNVLEPATRIRADDNNNAIIVSGSAADRFIINSLIERLDGSGRSFHVLQLRRLDAGDVAESIAFLMGQEKDDEDNSSRSRYRYYYGYYGNEDNSKKETDEFRVAANARFRQVLLWANQNEMEQVQSLLVKLGELPPPGGSQRTVRTIEAAATPETYEYLRRLQQQWNASSTNPMELPDPSEFKDPIKDSDDEASKSESEEAEADKGDNGGKKKKPSEGDVASFSNGEYQLTMMQTPTEAEIDPDASGAIRSSKDFDRLFNKPAPKPEVEQDVGRDPVRIQIDRDGNIVLLSQDTKALDRLENMMLQFKPPRRPYTVFKIEHASALWVRLNLEDFFEQKDDKGDSNADSFYRWYWDIDENSDDGPSGLGKGNSLRFVDDPDTNTIVVSGATREQLRTIDELIELWDVEEPTNKRKMRFTDLVTVKYGKAADIAETVKEAYRDLLSSNDKSFGRGANGQNGGGGGGNAGDRKGAQRSREGGGSGMRDRENGNEGGGVDFSFKGKLSIGVDSIGNTLLVSAEGDALLQLVTGMIEKLDNAARSADKLEVVQFSGNMSDDTFQQMLEAIGKKTSSTASPSTRRSTRNGSPE